MWTMRASWIICREYQDGVLSDDDLVVAVVGVGQERRTRSEKRDALILKAEILGVLRTPHRVETLLPEFLGRWRQRWNVPVRRVDHDRGAPRLDDAGAPFPVEVVVGAGSGPRRASRWLFIALGDLAAQMLPPLAA